MKKIIFITILLIVMAVNVNSQTISAPENVSLNLELTQAKQIPNEVADTLMDPMSILTSSDTLNISVFLETADTVNLSKIHLKLATTDGGNDLLDHVFDFDATPASGFFYERDGNLIKIGLGQYLYHRIYYCEIYFEDTFGNLSDVTKYQAN